MAEPVALCTFDDLQDRLSAAGVNLRTDDHPPRAWGNCILRGTADALKYLIKRYDPAQLSGSFWTSMKAADIAAFLLCCRRANPAPSSVALAYKTSIEDLKEVRRGDADLPDATPRRQGCPVMSITRVILGPQPHVRVRRLYSTTTGGEVTSYSQVLDASTMTDTWLNFPFG